MSRRRETTREHPERLAGAFLGGVFAVNALPHGISGVQGRRFPSPFASPPGRGLSAPATNVVWGIMNLVPGVLLLRRARSRAERVAASVGAAAMALFLARYFSDRSGSDKHGTADTRG